MADNGGAVIEKAPTLTEFLGVDICFSLPNWFPESRFNFRVYETLPENHAYHGQKIEKGTDNAALNELSRMAFVKEVNTTNISGNYVLFHLDDISIPRLQEAVKLLREVVVFFLEKWKRIYDEHPTDCTCRQGSAQRCNTCLNCGAALNEDLECPDCISDQEGFASRFGTMLKPHSNKRV